MRIESGVTTRYVSFVAVDATDLTTRETGLSSFTVYYDRNGTGSTAFTTPTVTEVDSTNMPGVYKLLLDEGTTISAGNDTEELILHITCSGMAPVTRAIELFRPKITTGYTLGAGSDGDLLEVNTLTGNTAQTGDSYVAITNLNNISSADVNSACNTAISDAALATAENLTIVYDIVDDILVDTGTTIPGMISTMQGNVTDILADTNELQTNQGNWATADVSGLATAANLAIVDTVVDAIKAKTDNLPLDPADQSAVEAAITSAHSTTNGKIDDLNDFDPSNDTVAHVTLVDTTITNSDMITDTSADVAAIKAVTDNLPDSGALTSIAQASTLADVLADTGTIIPAQISGLNNLSLADVNAACDTAISDAALATASALSTIDTVVDAIKSVTDLLPDAGALSSIATSSEIAALNNISVADIIAGIADGSYDLQEMIRIIFAFAAGKSNGGGTTTINFRDGADSKNRITATVDSNGNRTAVTVNGA